MYRSSAIDLYVITGVQFPLITKYIKKKPYLCATNKMIVAILHALIQQMVTVDVPTTTRANILHNSDDYIRDGQ
jgi:hypothetical protein